MNKGSATNAKRPFCPLMLNSLRVLPIPNDFSLGHHREFFINLHDKST